MFCLYTLVIEPNQIAKNEKKKNKHKSNPVSIDFETFGTRKDD